MNNDPALISQARQQFYNGKVSPTYSEPSIPWHNGHTKSVNNRLRTQRQNRNYGYGYYGAGAPAARREPAYALDTSTADTVMPKRIEPEHAGS